MATSTAPAYRNAGELKSANFAPAAPSPLERRIDASRLPHRYAHSLKHFVKESQQGPDLWASTFRASWAAGVSYKTMQRHLDWLERQKILHKKHAANEFISGKGLRRPATYVLNGTSAKWLAPRETYPQWQRRNRRHAPTRKPQAAPEFVSRPQAAPAPIAPAPVAICRSQPRGISRAEDRLYKRRLAAKGTVEHYMSKGMTQEQAIIEAVRMTSYTREEIEGDLQALDFKPPDPPKKMRPEPPDVPFERNPWKKILRALKANLNTHSFETWFSPTRLDHETAGTLFVRVPTADFRQIGSKFGDLIQGAINSLGLEIADVKFVTGEEESS